MGSYFAGEKTEENQDAVVIVPKSEKIDDLIVNNTVYGSSFIAVLLLDDDPKNAKKKRIVVSRLEGENVVEILNITEKKEIIDLVQFENRVGCFGYYHRDESRRNISFKIFSVDSRTILEEHSIFVSGMSLERIFLVHDSHICINCRPHGSWKGIKTSIYNLSSREMEKRNNTDPNSIFTFGEIRQVIGLENGNILMNCEIDFLSVAKTILIESQLNGNVKKSFNYTDNRYWDCHNTPNHFGYHGGQSVFDMAEVTENLIFVVELNVIRCFSISGEEFELKKTVLLVSEVLEGRYIHPNRKEGIFYIGQRMSSSAIFSISRVLKYSINQFLSDEEEEGIEESKIITKSIIPSRHRYRRLELGCDTELLLSCGTILSVSNGEMRLLFPSQENQQSIYKSEEGRRFSTQAVIQIPMPYLGNKKIEDDLLVERLKCLDMMMIQETPIFNVCSIVFEEKNVIIPSLFLKFHSSKE